MKATNVKQSHCKTCKRSLPLGGRFCMDCLHERALSRRAQVKRRRFRWRPLGL